MEGAKLILIIEDDAVLRDNIKELLELSGFRTITANNGKKGIEQAKNYLPNLVLCDILMPVLDGYAVLESLSENLSTREIPFLFISAKTKNTEIRKGMNLGADDYITKPFQEKDLIDAIRKRIQKNEILKNPVRKASKSSDNHNNISSLADFKNVLRSDGEKCNFKKRNTIYFENDKSNFVYLIETGLIKTIKMDDEGKELITYLYRPDNLFGLNSFKFSSLYDETAIAMEDGTGYRLSSKTFRELISNNPELTIEVAEVLSENLADLKEHLLGMAYGSVLKKTSHTILEFSKATQEGPKDIVSITRNELAHVAGISPESFIRSLSELRKKNIIKIEGRKIIILDFDKLKKI